MIPGQGSKIPHALGPKNQHIKQKQYCNKFNKGFKMVFIKKKSLKERINDIANNICFQGTYSFI